MPRHIALTVAAAWAAGAGIRRMTLRDPAGYPLPRVKPGAHVDLHVPEIGLRAYSLCGDPAIGDRWEIAIKRERNSRGGSAWLHDVVSVGDSLAASLPRCSFPLGPDASHHIMIAGGIGITPFLAMIPVLHRAGSNWVLHVISRGRPPCVMDLEPWLGTGRVVLHDTAAAPRPDLISLLSGEGEHAQAYCCGPEVLLDGFVTATRDWPEGRAQIEYFVPPVLAPPADARSYTLVRSSTGTSIDIAAGESMLAGLRALGANVEASCEGGICGACEVRWVEGEPVHRDRVLSPGRRTTHLISCVAACKSSRLVIDA